MKYNPKVSVITPYFKESDEVIGRCIESVRTQNYENISHYLVSDGYPNAILDSKKLRHIKLDQGHSDVGGTPRSVGGLCAIRDGADIICYLDADNLYTENHILNIVESYSSCLETGSDLPDAMFSYRHVFLPGHEKLRMADYDDLSHNHVDTNCMALLKGAFFVVPMWSFIPSKYTPIGDVVIFEVMRLYNLRFRWTGSHSVLYESNYLAHFNQAGISPPLEGLRDNLYVGLNNEDALPVAREIFDYFNRRL